MGKAADQPVHPGGKAAEDTDEKEEIAAADRAAQHQVDEVAVGKGVFAQQEQGAAAGGPKIAPVGAPVPGHPQGGQVSAEIAQPDFHSVQPHVLAGGEVGGAAVQVLQLLVQVHPVVLVALAVVLRLPRHENAPPRAQQQRQQEQGLESGGEAAVEQRPHEAGEKEGEGGGRKGIFPFTEF